MTGNIEESSSGPLTPEEDGRVVVFGIDPGVSTGWAWHAVDRADLMGLSLGRCLRAGEMGSGVIERSERGVPPEVLFGGVEAWDNWTVARLVALIRSAWVAAEVDPSLDVFVVASEDFILRTSDSARHTLAPVRLNAVLSYALSGTGVQFYSRQSASDAKRTVTDDRLRRMEVYEEGPEHRRDGRRHALLFLRRFAADQVFRSRWRVGLSSPTMGEIIARGLRER